MYLLKAKYGDVNIRIKHISMLYREGKDIVICVQGTWSRYECSSETKAKQEVKNILQTIENEKEN